MANNKIQIKRSQTTAVNGASPTLANGELAFTANGNGLWIGLPDGSANMRVGGQMVPGTLTANQALVANSTSGIDKIIVANAAVSQLNANGATGTAGQILKSGGAGGNSYWATPDAVVAGSDTQVQFNDGGTLAGDSGLTYNKTTDTLTVTGATTVGSATTSNSTGVFTTGTVNAATVSVGTSVIANSTRLAIGTAVGLQANGEIGTAGQVLHSNGTTVYWDSDNEGVTSVATGNGLTGGTITTTGTISVLANNGIVANSTGVFVTAGDGLVANATGVHVVPANGISVAADSVGVTTGSTLTVNTTGIHVNSALSITDLTLSGNLTINGTLTTVDTTNLTVKDSMIELANGNVSTDSLDIGFYGQYGATGTKYTGLFRDATDGIFKLFTGSQTEPTTTVDTGAAGYTLAVLQTYLNSGGLVSNATNVSITANSTLAVALVANTLSLTTALPTTSGGTGTGTYTSGDILVGNTSNALTKLSLGTSGYVLQSNGTALVYDTIDAGTF